LDFQDLQRTMNLWWRISFITDAIRILKGMLMIVQHNYNR